VKHVIEQGCLAGEFATEGGPGHEGPAGSIRTPRTEAAQTRPARQVRAISSATGISERTTIAEIAGNR
jgi:hypothetical protein